MFGLGFTEILLLALIAFLILGPRQFPSVLKNFIKILNELRAVFTEIKSEIYDVQTTAEKELYQIKNQLEKDLKSLEEPKREETSDNEKNIKNSNEKNQLR